MRRVERILISGLLLFSAAAALAEGPAPEKNDAEWPKTIPLGERKIVLDAPHAHSLEGTSLKAESAFGLVKPGETEPVWGSLEIEADVSVDRDVREVTLDSVRVSRVELSGFSSAQKERLATRLGPILTRKRLTLNLDEVLASARAARRHSDEAPKLGTEPPKVILETEPAVLVVFDGEPRFHALEGSRLERAQNTAFLVLHDAAAGTYYLDGGTTWFRASAVDGPWSATSDVPSEALAVAKHDREGAGVKEADVKKKDDVTDTRVPKIVIATTPTELIVSDGTPKWTSLVDGQVETLSASDNDVFRTPADGKVWVVLSGRWFRGDALTGPWTFVRPDQLPESFREIPSDSPRAEVLAFVPGTAAAREALEDASTPRTAAIRRKDAHVEVTYDGEPRFEEVPGTHVEYALNTPEQVLRIRGRFYVVDQGVWFSAASATGPWVVADTVPDEEIQAIPPQSPVYNTRFVTITDATPDVIYTAYTPAYLGSYPYYGTVVYGTGWAYRPWWGAAYYPRPFTWGFGAFYRPWFGWGYGFAWRPAWAGFRWGFGFGWGARWVGPGGFYRPAFVRASFVRNVNVTRNVTVNRNVNVTRNVYASGANATRANTTSQAHAATSAAQASGAKASGTKASGSSGAHAAEGKGAQAKGAAAGKGKPGGAGKEKTPKAKGGGVKSKGGGGKKH